jgi:hypothetical protein
MDSQLVTVDSIVRGAMSAMGEESLHKYQRCLQFGLQAAKTFYMDSARVVKTTKLTMSDIKQVDLPTDFVDWVKVGVVCGDRIKVFGVNENLPILVDEDACGNIVAYDNSDCDVNSFPADISNYGGYPFLNYINEYGEITGGLYGVGGGYTDIGYFRVLQSTGSGAKLQFNSEVNTSDVYIEYISNGFDPNTETVVHAYAADAIEFYIHWRIAWHKYGAASRDAQGAKAEYYDELHRARRRMMDLTTRDVLELSRKYYTQSPKY